MESVEDSRGPLTVQDILDKGDGGTAGDREPRIQPVAPQAGAIAQLKQLKPVPALIDEDHRN